MRSSGRNHPARCAAGLRMVTVDGMTTDWFFVTPFVVAWSQQASVILIAHTSTAVNLTKPNGLANGCQNTSMTHPRNRSANPSPVLGLTRSGMEQTHRFAANALIPAKTSGSAGNANSLKVSGRPTLPPSNGMTPQRNALMAFCCLSSKVS